MEDKLWFRAKRYGYGWRPVSWEGWMVILIYVGLVVVTSFTFENSGWNETLTGFITFLALIALFISSLIWICRKKGEPSHWRWGGK